MVEQVFPEAEFRRRIAALQARMDGAGQDALLLTTPADVFYATGFLTRFWESPARPWFVVVPANGEPMAIIPAIGAHLMGQTWVGDIRTWDAPDPQDDGVSLLVDAITEVVPVNGALGLPMALETHLRMPLGDYLRLESAIAPRRIVDATDTVQRVREVKSEAEVALIRETCRIADSAFARVPEIVANAPTLDAVFRGFQCCLLDSGADWVAYVAGGAGPGGYGDVISPADARPLERGDVLMLDTGAVRSGHFCDFDRNWSIGWTEEDTRRAYRVLWEATEGALLALRPGMTATDVHALLSGPIVKAGYPAPVGRLGHGLGLTLTEWPSLTARDQTPLVESMVLTLEPSLEIAPGRMLVHEENIVLRADGPELLSNRAPVELPEIAL